MNGAAFASALICVACAFQNFSYWEYPVSRFIGFLCAAGAVFCFWMAFGGRFS